MTAAGWTPPERAYAVCSLPRSGSNLLCALLEANGAGQPRELFHERELAQAPADKGAWMARQRQRGLAANGVFGVKLFPPHLVRLRRDHGIDFLRWFPTVKLLLLRRADILGQAISLALATQTGRWVHGNSTKAAPRYDHRLILRMLDHLVEWEGFWARYFALNGLSPYELVYEDLLRDPIGQMTPLLEDLGLGAVADRPAQRWLSQQRDDVNEAWRARFLEELARHGYRLADRPRRSRPGPASLADWLRGRLRRPPFAL